MGCWNHTCALSNLPVFHGDEVCVFLLEQVPHDQGHNLVRSTSMWRPGFIHFTGKYNDYGAVEQCEGLLLPTLIESIKERLVEVEQGENDDWQPALKKENLTIETLFEADLTGCLAVRSRVSNNPVVVRHIVILKSVLDKLLQHYTTAMFGKVVTYSQAIESGNQYVKQIVKNLVSAKENSNSPIDHLPSVQRIRIHERTLFTSLLEYDEIRFSSITSPSIVLDDCAHEMFVCSSQEQYTEAFTRLNETVRQICVSYILSLWMNDARKAWHPQIGQGSQNENTEAQRLMATIVLEQAKLIEHGWDEDDYEYE